MYVCMYVCVCVCVCSASPGGEDMHRFAGSDTESEAAALDKEFWVKRAAEVGWLA